jgi:hypothetical protein
LTTALVTVLVVVHVAIMLPVATTKLEREGAPRSPQMQIASALAPVVADRPCMLVGRGMQAAAYQLRCRAQGHGLSPRPPDRVRRAAAEGLLLVAVLGQPPAHGSYLATWRRVPVPEMPATYQAYLPPS